MMMSLDGIAWYCSNLLGAFLDATGNFIDRKDSVGAISGKKAVWLQVKHRAVNGAPELNAYRAMQRMAVTINRTLKQYRDYDIFAVPLTIPDTVSCGTSKHGLPVRVITAFDITKDDRISRFDLQLACVPKG